MLYSHALKGSALLLAATFMAGAWADTTYPIVDGLRQRPEDQPITLVDGSYTAPFPGSLGGQWIMMYRDSYVTIKGRGYYRMRWEAAFFNRPGELVMPTYTNQTGQLIHVADGGGHRMDDAGLNGGPGQTWLGNPTQGYQTLPAGTPMIWNNQYFYLDGQVTITNRERGADYNISITPVTWQTVRNDIMTAAGSQSWAVRPGVSRDPYNGASLPAAPSELKARAVSDSRVDLTWKDNANNEDGHLVEYSTDGKDYVVAGTYKANVASLPIGMLNASTHYFFRVRGYNAAGNSAYSNVAEAATLGPKAVMSPWQQLTIGNGTVPGEASQTGGLFTVRGSGGDIWDTDNFHFLYRPLNGSGTLIARVASTQYTNRVAKVGVMIRETLDTDARYLMTMLTPGNGAAQQRRNNPGGNTGKCGSSNVAAPYWVKLVRDGRRFLSYVSPDGITWSFLCQNTNEMGGTVFAGLVVSSFNANGLNTTSFDNVSLTPTTLTAGSALHTLQPANTPGLLVRHTNTLGMLAPIDYTSASLARDDASFRFRAGLADSNCFSLESKNYPGHYLRHQSQRIRLARNDNSALFAQDATWCAVPGLAGDGLSFQSKNFPDHYLRHRGNELWSDVPDGSNAFKADATFYLPVQSWAD